MLIVNYHPLEFLGKLHKILKFLSIQNIDVVIKSNLISKLIDSILRAYGGGTLKTIEDVLQQMPNNSVISSTHNSIPTSPTSSLVKVENLPHNL